MDGIVMASILGAILIFAIDWFAAVEMLKIAGMKGHNDRKYFWWSFWIPLYGIAMVIALPDRKDGREKDSIAVDELPEL